MMNVEKSVSDTCIDRATTSRQALSADDTRTTDKVVNVSNRPEEMQQVTFSRSDIVDLFKTDKKENPNQESIPLVDKSLKSVTSTGNVEKLSQPSDQDKVIQDLLKNNEKKEITLSLKACFAGPENTNKDGNVVAGIALRSDSYHYDGLLNALVLRHGNVANPNPVDGIFMKVVPLITPGYKLVISFEENRADITSLNKVFLHLINFTKKNQVLKSWLLRL